MGVQQGVAITLEGGLDESASSFQLFKTPGAATELQNFESSVDGGYRRVNGFVGFVSSPVLSIIVDDGGAGYEATSISVAISSVDGSGSEAIGVPTLDGNGTVTAISVVAAPGQGYLQPPQVVISGLSTSPAKATSVINTPTSPTATEEPVEGIHAHAEGGWLCKGGDIYWSENGYSWINVSKETGHCHLNSSVTSHTTQQSCEEHAAGATWEPEWKTQTELEDDTAGSVLPDIGLTGGNYSFSEMATSDGTETHNLVTAVNGNDPVMFLETKKDSNGNRVFKCYQGLYRSFGMDYDSSDTTIAQIPKPSICTTHENHSILSGWASKSSVLYYSERYVSTNFTASSSGLMDIGDTISGIKSFRKDLIIFGINSLRKLINITNNNILTANSISLVDITKNIGCVSGESIQEIGGDLIFLAPDGLRTVAATARIDDTEISTISHKVSRTVREIVNNLHKYSVRSLVIRSKNQYRLYYSNPDMDEKGQRALIATFKVSPQLGPTWEWSELRGVSVSAVTSGVDANNVERLYHGDFKGNLYAHDRGNSFGGRSIPAYYTTPDIDFGDIGVRKTLHSAKLSIKPEGDADISFSIGYDFDSPGVMQPPPTPVGKIQRPAIFGVGHFDNASFGAPKVPMKRVALVGGGFSNNLKFYSDDTNAPYSIQGLYVDIIPSGRR